MSDQARIETAIDTTIDNCEVLRARLAKYEDADGRPLRAVVLPEPLKRGDEGGSGEYGAAMIRGYNACLREVARLNSSPVSAGESFCEYCGGNDEEPQDHCMDCTRPVSAGEYGDAYQGAREDLAIWKRRALEAETKVREQDRIIDHLTLEAQGETRFGEPAVSAGEPVYQFQCREIGEGGFDACDHDRYIYCQKSPEHDTRVVQVGLQAPSHGVQVRDGWQLVPVEPTPEMLAAGDKYIGTPATYKAMLSACPSPAITKDFSQFLSAVMDAAGLIRHGRQSKELSEYLGMKCMEYRGVALSAPSHGERVRESLLSRAATHYEAALQAAFPSGSSGEVFSQWNEARRLIAKNQSAGSQEQG